MSPVGNTTIDVDGFASCSGGLFAVGADANLYSINAMTGAVTTGPALTGTTSSFYGLPPDPLTGPSVTAPARMVAWWPGNGGTVDILGGNNGVLTNGEIYTAGEV